MATVKTLTVYPSGYVSDDYAYASASNLENGYNSADNTTYATINLTTGSGAETYIYYTFDLSAIDLSAIPDGAVITSVSCSANVTISSTSIRYISSRTMQLYSGTTAKGSSASIPSSAAATTITAGNWTKDELTDCRLKLYAKRTRSGTTTAININFYGASLTIEYAEPDIIPIVGNITVGGVAKTLAGGYVNIGGVWKTICKSYSNINGIWKPMYTTSSVQLMLGELTVGTSIFMNLGGTLYEWIIIYQGNPSSSVYDSSCNGTWIILKDIYTEMAWGDATNGYCDTAVHTYLNDTFLNLFDANIKNNIKSVKIPYTYGTSNSAALTGSDGLSTKVFLLSATETDTSDANVYTEGASLGYFTSNSLRIAYYNDTATDWLTRSQYKNNTGYFKTISSAGASDWSNVTSRVYGIRPALIMPSETLVDDSMNVIS